MLNSQSSLAKVWEKLTPKPAATEKMTVWRKIKIRWIFWTICSGWLEENSIEDNASESCERPASHGSRSTSGFLTRKPETKLKRARFLVNKTTPSKFSEWSAAMAEKLDSPSQSSKLRRSCALHHPFDSSKMSSHTTKVWYCCCRSFWPLGRQVHYFNRVW